MSISKTKHFETLVNNHDLTFSYSDDGGVLRRGEDSLRAIKEAAKDLPIEDVRRIWAAKVDRTISPGYRQDWYWKG